MGANKQNARDFKTMWIKCDLEDIEKHQMFFKEHSVRNQDLMYPRGHTLFLLNVPPFATEEAIKQAFSELCGTVQSVTFTTPTGFKTAYIVFEEENGLDNALSLSTDTVMILYKKKNEYIMGLDKWCREYNASISSEKELKRDIEEYMRLYDEKIAMRAQREKEEKEREEAENGWVKVTGQKKRGKFALARKESTINKVQSKEKERKVKKQLHNFYTFQIREKKKQHLAELRQKFEMDKKKLEELKKKRTFKPF